MHAKKTCVFKLVGVLTCDLECYILVHQNNPSIVRVQPKLSSSETVTAYRTHYGISISIGLKDTK